MDVPQSPFHAGEVRVQERLGVREVETYARHYVRGFLPEQHRTFYASLPFVVAAARDERGLPWATLLVGRPGFLRSPDPRSLELDAAPIAGDALAGAFAAGRDLGLLGIELSTRRRNRVNGRIAGDGVGPAVLTVEQSFGNCPQYIHERDWRIVTGEPAGAPVRSRTLSASQRAWIARADTFFIASGYRSPGESPTFGMDASHRGGAPGFARASETRVTFPDYAGNNHFNTVGNLVVDPRAGLLFVDFATGSLLQLTGRATIQWDPSAEERAAGAQRTIAVDVDEVVELPGAVPLRWSVAAETRSLRVVEKIRESADVTSFYLQPVDDAPLAAFAPGQYLPIRLDVAGGERLERTYSLSGPPAAGFYRISVKRAPDGRASRRLHEDVAIGDVLRAGPPAGDFVLAKGDGPVVLVSAGVGITPMIAMLHALAAEGRLRPVWFLHGARDGAHLPFAREVAHLAKKRGRVVAHTAFSQPRPGDAGQDVVGRIDAETFTLLEAPVDADYYLCGPTAFMASIQEVLQGRGVAADRIHAEAFGPAAGAAR